MNLISKLFSTLFILLVLSNFADSQTVYTWNGSVNSNFSTAGNWTPFRQIGMVTDILVFENSGNLNVTNVSQVTIGQLIIKNNTNLTLSPATGNARLVTIKGAAGEDLVIENGSSLRILSNDPALNFYLGTSATAQIKGNLTFEGSIGHYINSADEMAIKFKSGSTFTQLCPGSIFNTIGVSNAVVFETGSTFVINHTNALNPFGISAPNSKVMFERSSSLVISRISSLQLAGRRLADLTLEQGENLNISESYTSDINIGNITIKNNAALIITNTNSNYIPFFNIAGDINVNGSLKFSSIDSSKFRINFNGTAVQNISGSGEIVIPENLKSFELSNTIALQRDLTVSCRILLKGYSVNMNNFVFTYNPSHRNPFYTNNTSSITVGKNVIDNPGSEKNVTVPSEFSISQNYPNPFNPSTKIDFSLPVDSKVSIKVYDISGKEVSEIINASYIAGKHTVEFNASKLSSGVYFYTINAENFTKTVKMILAK